MLLFVIFDGKKFGQGSAFPAVFQAFLPLERILLLVVQVRKVVANGVVFPTFGATALWCNLVTKSKPALLPMVYS